MAAQHYFLEPIEDPDALVQILPSVPVCECGHEDRLHEGIGRCFGLLLAGLAYYPCSCEQFRRRA